MWNGLFIYDAQKNCLKYVRHSLAPKNYENFGQLVAGLDVSEYFCLRGKALDHALVDKEQALVSQQNNQYYVIILSCVKA